MSLCSSSCQDVDFISPSLKLGLAMWFLLHCKQKLEKWLHNEACPFLMLLGILLIPVCGWAHWRMNNTCSANRSFIVPANSQPSSRCASEVINHELTAAHEGTQPTPCMAASPLAPHIYHTHIPSYLQVKPLSELLPLLVTKHSSQLYHSCSMCICKQMA